MSKINVNDIVRFLNDVGGGRVTRIDGKTVYVEDEDGFERPALERDLVVVGQAGGANAYERAPQVRTRLVEPDKPAPRPAQPEPVLPVEETPEGEVLNVVLAYEARELKHLPTTTFYASLVNDSNYYLYFCYMTRGDDATGEWTTRYHGVVEPNIQVQLEEFGHDDLNNMTHIAVQYIAFKHGKGFKLKNPALVEQRLDVTKFYKLHCFHDNPYFEVPVIAVEIVTNDRPARAMHIDSGELERAMQEKKRADRPHRRPVVKRQDNNGIVVQDLHIGALMDNMTGMTPAAILEYQLDKFREVMDDNIMKRGQRIVFIHGKGEGKLRMHLLEELKRRYPRCTAQDASFREYGFGATQVTIR